jgi:hypothetical protein
MCDKLINFFFKIEENVAPNGNATMLISLDLGILDYFCGL